METETKKHQRFTKRREREKKHTNRSCDEQDESPSRSDKRTKPRRKKNNANFIEEDIIDGFAIISFKTFEDLENAVKNSMNLKPGSEKKEKKPNTPNREKPKNNAKKKEKNKLQNRVSSPPPTPPLVKLSPEENLDCSPGSDQTEVLDLQLNGDQINSISQDSDASSHSSSGRGYLCDSESGDERASDASSDIFTAVNRSRECHIPSTTTCSSPCRPTSLTTTTTLTSSVTPTVPASSVTTTTATTTTCALAVAAATTNAITSTTTSCSSASKTPITTASVIFNGPKVAQGPPIKHHQLPVSSSSSSPVQHPTLPTSRPTSVSVSHRDLTHKSSSPLLSRTPKREDYREKDNTPLPASLSFNKPWASANNSSHQGYSPQISPTAGLSSFHSTPNHAPTFHPHTQLLPHPPSAHTPGHPAHSMFAPPLPPGPAAGSLSTRSLGGAATHSPGDSMSFANQEILREELNRRFLETQDRPTPSAIGAPPYPMRTDIHQHQHQHMHQHQHTHQHMYPIPFSASLGPPPAPLLYEKVPKLSDSPFYRQGIPGLSAYPADISPLLPPAGRGPLNSGIPGAFQPKRIASSIHPAQMRLAPIRDLDKATPTNPVASLPPQKKSGKWCAVHVRIAWEIYQQQQKQVEAQKGSDGAKSLDPLRPPSHLLPISSSIHKPPDLNPASSLLASASHRSMLESNALLGTGNIGVPPFPRPSPFGASALGSFGGLVMDEWAFAKLAGIPGSMRWPVQVLERSLDGIVQVYCKSDNAVFSVKHDCLKKFPDKFWEEKGLNCLKKKKKTLECFQLDLQWATDNYRRKEEEASEREKSSLVVKRKISKRSDEDIEAKQNEAKNEKGVTGAIYDKKDNTHSGKDEEQGIWNSKTIDQVVNVIVHSEAKENESTKEKNKYAVAGVDSYRDEDDVDDCSRDEDYVQPSDADDMEDDCDSDVSEVVNVQKYGKLNCDGKYKEQGKWNSKTIDQVLNVIVHSEAKENESTDEKDVDGGKYDEKDSTHSGKDEEQCKWNSETIDQVANEIMHSEAKKNESTNEKDVTGGKYDEKDGTRSGKDEEQGKWNSKTIDQVVNVIVHSEAKENESTKEKNKYAVAGVDSYRDEDDVGDCSRDEDSVQPSDADDMEDDCDSDVSEVVNVQKYGKLNSDGKYKEQGKWNSKTINQVVNVIVHSEAKENETTKEKNKYAVVGVDSFSDEDDVDDCSRDEDYVQPSDADDTEDDLEDDCDSDVSEVVNVQKYDELNSVTIDQVVNEIVHLGAKENEATNEKDVTGEKYDEKDSTHNGKDEEQENTNEEYALDRPLERKVPVDTSDCVFDKKYPEIFMKKYQKGNKKSKHGRLYDRVYACLFCHELLTNIQTHMVNKHGNRACVKELQKLKTTKPSTTEEEKLKELNKEINRKLTLLRNKGNSLHNKKVLKWKKGELLVSRRSGKEFSVDDYGPCPSCDEWIMINSSITNHQLTCPASESNEYCKGVTMIKAAVLTGKITMKGSKTLQKEVIPCMKRDAIAEIAINDDLIMGLGDIWVMRNIDNKRKRKYYASFHMRLAARLLQKLREKTGLTSLSLDEALKPSNFDNFVECAMICGQSESFEHGTDEITHPSTPVKLGWDITRLTGLKLANSIKRSNEEARKDANDFIHLMKMEWHTRVNRLARATQAERQFNKHQPLPDPEDIVNIADYLVNELNKLADKLDPASANPIKFREVVMLAQARLMLYNRRRPGELEALSLEYYSRRSQKLTESDMSLRQHLTPLEKKMLETQELVDIRGKNGTRVPVIIPKEVVPAMNFLANPLTRSNSEIKEDNRFIFANSALDVVRAANSLEVIRGRCQLKYPERIHATNLRKHCATIAQVIGLKDHEMKWLCRHLGHTQHVHDQHYKATSGLIERLDIAKLMLMQEGNMQGKFHGKSLQDISFDDILNDENDAAEVVNDVQTDMPVADQLTDGDDVEDFMQDDGDIFGTRQKPKKSTRVAWTSAEEEEIKKYFPEYFNGSTRRTCPTQKECVLAVAKSKECKGTLHKRHWETIKKKVYNCVKKQKEKQQ